MHINALMMDPRDNVVTCVAAVAAGDPVCYRNGSELCELKAIAAIPFCHKIALVDLPLGSTVFKYGEMIGQTTADVVRGGLVDHHNLVSVPRDYDSELVVED